MQNIYLIVNLNQDSSEVAGFINNTLTSGLRQFMRNNEIVYDTTLSIDNNVNNLTREKK